MMTNRDLQILLAQAARSLAVLLREHTHKLCAARYGCSPFDLRQQDAPRHA